MPIVASKIRGIGTAFALAMIAGCASDDPCMQTGNGSFEDIRLLSELAQASGLPLEMREAAFIAGMALAHGQLESGGQVGNPVRVCLREGSNGITEYRVLSVHGAVLGDWERPAIPRDQ